MDVIFVLNLKEKQIMELVCFVYFLCLYFSNNLLSNYTTYSSIYVYCYYWYRCYGVFDLADVILQFYTFNIRRKNPCQAFRHVCYVRVSSFQISKTRNVKWIPHGEHVIQNVTHCACFGRCVTTQNFTERTRKGACIFFTAKFIFLTEPDFSVRNSNWNFI
jgi:hypothetical protein